MQQGGSVVPLLFNYTSQHLIMLTSVHPKLPMRNNTVTREYYVNQLGFTELSNYGHYLIVEKEQVQLHFFAFRELNPLENYSQVYLRCNGIEELYQSLLKRNVSIHPNGTLETKPWGQKEFSLLDPDHNLLTFGEGV